MKRTISVFGLDSIHFESSLSFQFCNLLEPMETNSTSQFRDSNSFANEIYQLCEKVGADYDKVIEYATMDERLGESHWGVPGHDGDFGFGGHCFPKDLSALLHLTKELGTTNNVLEATKKTNNELRKNRDWETMKGRAVV